MKHGICQPALYLFMSGRGGDSFSYSGSNRCSFVWDLVPLSNLYVLCEKLQDVIAKNVIVDAFMDVIRHKCETCWHYPNSTDVNIIYDGTMETSPLRQLLVDVYVKYAINENHFDYDQLPKRFIYDVMVGKLTQKGCLIEFETVSKTQKYFEKTERNGHETALPLPIRTPGK